MRRIPRVWQRQMTESQINSTDARFKTEPITADQTHRLRPGWTSRYDRPDIRNIVSQYPDVSQWIPETGEYLIAGPWRHRSDVSSVLELSGREGAATLLRSFADSSREKGIELALLSEQEESRDPSLYDRAGFELLEHIMIYELSNVPMIRPERFRLSFNEMMVLRDADLNALLELDHEAFPWLWWNSEGEFLNYGRARGVQIYGGWDESGQLVSYIGVTRFRSWGHLDRIAVRPDLQGQGIGLESLDWALYVLAQSGARRIGLSTQARNERSRLLYERYGFHRTHKQDYYLYGEWLQQEGEDVTDKSLNGE
jgi:ribosomal protein S18 acetylase RimI-like enzyme